VFDKDPPQAFGFGGNSTNYPSFLYTSEGRFIYASLNKKF
jgi:outer membrane receptor protein involved in Fe transport